MGKSKTKEKKNEFSNAVHQALVGAVSEFAPSALLRGPVVWSSQTKGKLSLWLPKGDKLTKEQTLSVEDKACQVVAADASVDAAYLESFGVLSADKQALTTGGVQAVAVPKFNMRFFRPNETVVEYKDGKETEWELQLLIGKPAVDARVKRASGGEGDAKGGDSKGKKEKKSEKSEGKKNKAKAPVYGKNTHSPADVFALKLVDDVLLKTVAATHPLDKEQAARLRSDLLLNIEGAITAFYNTTYTNGFVAGTSAASPPAESVGQTLQNRL